MPKATKAAALKKPALTHREAFNFFPILRRVSEGFNERGLNDPEKFLRASGQHGDGAFICARFVLNIWGYSMSIVTDQTFTIYSLFNRVDSEHKKAAVRLFRAVAERGVK